MGEHHLLMCDDWREGKQAPALKARYVANGRRIESP